jgi:hypothetical protein
VLFSLFWARASAAASGIFRFGLASTISQSQPSSDGAADETEAIVVMPLLGLKPKTLQQLFM